MSNSSFDSNDNSSKKNDIAKSEEKIATDKEIKSEKECHKNIKEDEALNELKDKNNLNESEKKKESEKITENNKIDSNNEKVTKKPFNPNDNPFLKPIPQKISSDTPKTQSNTSSTTNDIESLKSIFISNCKLYRFDTTKNQMIVRGQGKICITKYEERNLYRILMVREKVARTGCNHFVDPLLNANKHNSFENIVVWHTESNKAEEGEKIDSKQTFCAKFEDVKVADEFMEKFKFAQDENKKVVKSKKVDQ